MTSKVFKLMRLPNISIVLALWTSAFFLLPPPVPGGAGNVDNVLKKIHGLTPAQRRAALEEGARKEGEVVVYTSMSLSDYPKVMKDFVFVNPATIGADLTAIITTYQDIFGLRHAR
jgi:hypothetical protein